MKIHPEDPRLTDHSMGELGPEENDAVEAATLEDPAIRAEVVETKALQKLLTDLLVPHPEKLLPQQRENVRRTARAADRGGKVISFSKIREALNPWLIPASAVAVLSAATLILIQIPKKTPALAVSTKAIPAGIKLTPATAPNIPEPAPISSFQVQRGSIMTADSATLKLPILTEKSNLLAVSKSIREEGKLPAQNTVRVEEILNYFPLRLNGVSAIARSGTNSWHPDTRGSGSSAHIATLSTEMIACPWKPSATLLFISLRGNAISGSDVKITFHVNPASVIRYRLLGFAPIPDQPEGPLPANLPADSTTTLAVEIEASQSGADLGLLEWSTDGKAAPAIPLLHKIDKEPSDDSRFAALVCTYAQWLAAEQSGLIDADIVSGLAREIASSSLSADRSDFLNLIDKSLHL